MKNVDIVGALNQFENIRAERVPRAEEFLRDATSLTEVLADLTNILTLLNVATLLNNAPQGFIPTGKNPEA